MNFDKYDTMGAYHWRDFRSNTTYRKHAIKILNWVTEKKILDIGCGDGLITFLLGDGVKGIDDNETAIKLAKEKGVNAELCSIYDFNETEKFSAIFMGDVLEHFEFPDKVLEKISNMSIPNLYITTPPSNKNNKIGKYHYREYTPGELKEYIEKFGWKTESIETVNRNIYAKFVK